jgi:DNA-binding transcriptional LysR family regulator
MYASVFNRKGLSLERLRRFCEVVGAGSIADAEDRNRRAQPSYSRDIAALERYFNMPLFGRTAGRARAGRRMAGLTAQGRAVHALATDILHRLEEIQEATETPTRIRIGGGETVMQWVVAAHLPAITKALPRTTVEVANTATQEETIAALQTGRLNFAIVDETALRDAPFHPRATPLGTLTYALYVHADAIQTATRRNRNRLLSHLPWVTLRDATRTATEVIAELQHRNIPVPLAATLTTFKQAAAVLKGRELAALLPTVADRDMTALGYTRLDHPDLQTVKIPISLLYNEDQLPQHPYLPDVAETLGRIMVPLDERGEKRA